MPVRQTVLEKLDWTYAADETGPEMRFAFHEDDIVVQQRVTFAENSKTRLMQKAMRGEYTLHDLEVIGTGNSYLIRGWETTSVGSLITGT